MLSQYLSSSQDSPFAAGSEESTIPGRHVLCAVAAEVGKMSGHETRKRGHQSMLSINRDTQRACRDFEGKPGG